MYNDAAAAAKSFQSGPTLWDPIDGSPPGSPIPGILQARILEWVAISFSNAWKWKVKVKSLSRVQFFTTPWTAAYQAPLSMGFSRQEYWSGVPLPSLSYSWGKFKCLLSSLIPPPQSTESSTVKCLKCHQSLLWGLNGSNTQRTQHTESIKCIIFPFYFFNC